MINLVMNILWLILGGFATALGWFLAALLMLVSIIGIPWARAAFNIGIINLWPFGSEVFDRSELTDKKDIGTGGLGLLGNIIWFVFAGLWLGLAHFLFGVLFCITIIGIPFGLQHFKIAGISFMPIGKTILIK